MKTLSEFKRVVAEPNTTLTLIASSFATHKYLNLTRKVAVAQTNAFALESEGNKSWVTYGKASDWTFGDSPEGPIASQNSNGVLLVYVIGKGE